MNKFKNFEDIQVGDTGVDYNGIKGEVVDYGSISYISMNYDKYGMLEEGIEEGYIDEDSDAVVVEIDGEVIGYVYGDDGFQCFND